MANSRNLTIKTETIELIVSEYLKEQLIIKVRRVNESGYLFIGLNESDATELRNDINYYLKWLEQNIY